MQRRWAWQYAVLASVFVTGLGWSTAVFAQSSIHGVITERGENGLMAVQTDDGSNLIVVLNDSTKIRRIDGARQMKQSSAALIPGLLVKVDGQPDTPDRFMAFKVQFTRSDLKMARAIAGGVTPTDQRTAAIQQALQQHAHVLQQHGQALDRQAQAIAAQGQQINAATQKMVATTGALNARINNLNDWNALSTVTVYFANGKATIAPKYVDQLRQFAAQAKGTPASVIQVQGYASNVGSKRLNDKLSMQRADAVTAVLQQNGIAPTNIAVPAAMGVTDQVASNKTKKGQAENRRTVVTLLQNKGVSSTK